MPKEFSRTSRIEAQIQREVAPLIQYKMRDPRVHSVNITGVKVSGDLAFADIFFTVHDEENKEAVVDVLNNAAGFLRKELAHCLRLRAIPSIKFIYDQSITEGHRLSRLIDETRAKEREQTNVQDQTNVLS